MKLRIIFLITLVGIFILTACSGTNIQGIKVGATAPNFTLQSADGKTYSLSDYVGKQPVLLYFHMANG